MGVFSFLKGILAKSDLEPEYEETVEHDTVMIMAGNELVEVTADDPEAEQRV